MAHEVTVRTVGASATAVVAERTTWDQFPRIWPALLDEVYAVIRAGGVAQTGHNVMLYLDDTPSVEVGVEVAGPFEPMGRVVPSSLPAGRVAGTRHRGPYGGLGAAHAAVRSWCDVQGLPLTGTRWEVYGDWQEDPADLETEVIYLLG